MYHQPKKKTCMIKRGKGESQLALLLLCSYKQQNKRPCESEVVPSLASLLRLLELLKPNKIQSDRYISTET